MFRHSHFSIKHHDIMPRKLNRFSKILYQFPMVYKIVCVNDETHIYIPSANATGSQDETRELPGHDFEPVEILKSIVYGGLMEVTPSLSIVASVASGDASTRREIYERGGYWTLKRRGYCHGIVTPERHMFDSGLTSASAAIHEGVKTIAKMVKWLLTSFHVKIKKLIVALDLSSLESDEIGDSRMLVLHINEMECGTRISEDVDIDNGKCDESATTSVITGDKGGFSGTIKLSIPLKNGSLDIRKLDADVCVDPLEIRLQPSSIKIFMYFVNVFEELDKEQKSLMNSIATKSIYHSVSATVLEDAANYIQDLQGRVKELEELSGLKRNNMHESVIYLQRDQGLVVVNMMVPLTQQTWKRVAVK
ncbi:autophagy-related protein 2 [Tanacetum coccineum]